MSTFLRISIVILTMSLLPACKKVEPKVPTVVAADAESITATTALVKGTIINDGGAPVISRGVCWNTSGNPTIEDSKTVETDKSNYVVVSSNLTQLSPNTNYYFRAYATNSAGTGYSQVLSFYTSGN